MSTAAAAPTLRVKVMTTIPTSVFAHQAPGGLLTWGNCRFSFDPNDRDYDWLVAYDDLSAKQGEPRSQRHEVLACPREHTLLTTSEPSTIKHFGRDYTAQFGHVLTSQAEWALPHPHRIYSHARLKPSACPSKTTLYPRPKADHTRAPGFRRGECVQEGPASDAAMQRQCDPRPAIPHESTRAPRDLLCVSCAFHPQTLPTAIRASKLLEHLSAEYRVRVISESTGDGFPHAQTLTVSDRKSVV
jgi:hypothetical protein